MEKPRSLSEAIMDGLLATSCGGISPEIIEIHVRDYLESGGIKLIQETDEKGLHFIVQIS